MELSILALIVWGEITFLLAGTLVLLLLNNVVNKRKGKKSINALFEKLESDRDERIAVIREGLANYGLDGEVLENKVREIDQQEQKLYRRISKMYLNRSDGMLARINVAVETANEPYYELDLSSSPVAAGLENEQEETEADTSELEQLRKSNQQLQDELAVTMDTIGRMLSEYSSMFGTEDEGDLDKNKIMKAFNVDESGDELEDVATDVPLDDVAGDLEVKTGDEDELEIALDAGVAEPDELAEREVEDIPAQADDGLDVVLDENADAILQEIDVSSDELLEIGDELPGEDGSTDDLDVVLDQEDVDVDAILEDIEVPSDELLEIGDELPGEDGAAEDLDVLLDEDHVDVDAILADSDIPSDELLEIGDELPAVDDAADDLDVVLDEDDADVDAILEGIDVPGDEFPDKVDAAIADEVAELVDEDLLNEDVSLKDDDVAILEAAGLTDIVDLETDLEVGHEDELADLDVDDLLASVGQQDQSDKVRVEDVADDELANVKIEDVTSIDDLDIDNLLDSNKNT